MTTTTTTTTTIATAGCAYFSSDIPFSLFTKDSKQGSVHNLNEESKTFLWHQFMLDVLLNVPRSPKDLENVIAACYLVNDYDRNEPIALSQQEIDKFLAEYRSDMVMNWYTRDSFLYRAFNKACRMLNSDAIVLFHPLIKDLSAELKQYYNQQMADGKLALPLTVYRGQTKMDNDELKKIQENIGGLISMHTFLSTTFSCEVACKYVSGADPNTTVLFQITINDTEQGKHMSTFASIAEKSSFKDEIEVLFGVSSVFRIISVQQEDCFWFIELELTTFKQDETVQRFMSEVQTYLYQNSENESIDDKLKFFIHGILEASHATIEVKDLVWESDQMAIDALQTSLAQFMPGWFPNLIASSHVTMDDSNQRIDNEVSKSELFISQELLGNTVDEKLRLLYLGHTYSQKGSFLEALNYWEEAVEIESHMPCSAEMIFNGCVYVQMAAAYFRVNNKIDALDIMEKAIKCLEPFYPLTHRMFATLNFMYGYYLMYNEKLSEAIKYLEKSLNNPYFSENKDFCAQVNTLLASVSIQLGDLDSAKSYCHQAIACKSPSIGAQATLILREIPQLEMLARYNGIDFIRESISRDLLLVQQLISQKNPHLSTARELNDEETWTSEKLISVADHYRHRRNNQRAELYYSKALDKMIETESKSMWNVYKKIVRMGNNSERCWDYFIQQFSKFVFLSSTGIYILAHIISCRIIAI
ncbi:unnamed protein product [Rotaria sp. Silwood2]|nr:unnamed protein product [Rotaria sp. Silwood2]